MMIITITTTISTARETPDLYIEIGCKIIFLRLGDRYLRIATELALNFQGRLYFHSQKINIGQRANEYVNSSTITCEKIVSSE